MLALTLSYNLSCIAACLILLSGWNRWGQPIRTLPYPIGRPQPIQPLPQPVQPIGDWQQWQQPQQGFQQPQENVAELDAATEQSEL